MATIKKISLKNLWVNTENYRFEPVESQAKAIKIMAENQKEKLLTIAEHISQKGMNPIDLPIVTDMLNHKGKYLVLEGNRRITSLKIFEHPDLLKDASVPATLIKKFRTLNDKFSQTIPEKIECVYFSDPSEADEWIKLKHTGENNGVGTVSWDGQQVGRYQVRVGEKSSPGLQVIEYLKKQKDFDSSLKKKLSDVKVTTLTRLITDKDVQQVLGIYIEEGKVVSRVPENEVLKGYTEVIKNLLTKGFTVKSVYTKEQREEYAKNFPLKARPDLSKADGTDWHTTSASSETSTVTNTSLPKNKKIVTDRNKVIPKGCTIPISNHKVNTIYGELQRLTLSEFIHAPAALLRVFIELSFDIYIETHKLTTTPSSAKSGTNLSQKGFQVINHMTNKGWADKATSIGMSNLLKDKDGILSMETLHAYIHNHRVTPTAETLKLTWDGIQDFIIALWNNIK